MQHLSTTEIAFLMVASQQVVLSLAWLVGAGLLPVSRRAMLEWALHAALSAASVGCFVVSVEPGDEAVRAIGNLCIVASLIALQRGVCHFFGCRQPWRWHVVVMLAAVVATAYGLDPQYVVWRVTVISGSLALLCFSTAWDLQAQAQRRLELRWGAALAIPVLLAGLVFAFRSFAAMAHPEALVSAVANTSFNAGSAMLYQIVALAFQLTLIALVVSQFVAELQNASRFDALTGLLNRRAFDEALAAEVQRSRRLVEAFSVLMLDADHFKDINDREGHAAGDRALQHLGTLLAAHMRDIDRVGRYGGEEFVVLLPGTAEQEARLTAERLRAKVEALPPRWQERALRLTVSIGVSQWRGEGDDVASLMARADEALYRAKEAGRNRVVV
ncbi:MAG TPA: GGDEF domain-containing protein [Albitalea sp.]|uniref:GGDEF domain-containing protein n=1 Tax=Piscinibacter sp. TaxID=1903157 RepID=UPI002ED2D35A